jgi:hypothetical protein
MNDINTLMSRIDTINAKTPRDLTDSDIDTLIAFHRRNRARKAAGQKGETPTKSTIDISALLNLPIAKAAPAVPQITRRF